MADSPEFTRQSTMLHALYIRGRHNMISTLIATQKFNPLHPTIRVNATELFVYRLRHMKDFDTFIYEDSAVLDKKHYWKCITRQPLSRIRLCTSS